MRGKTPATVGQTRKILGRSIGAVNFGHELQLLAFRRIFQIVRSKTGSSSGGKKISPVVGKPATVIFFSRYESPSKRRGGGRDSIYRRWRWPVGVRNNIILPLPHIYRLYIISS